MTSRINNLEVSAKAKAVKRIANLIQRPDQLEKVEEYKKREIRKKVSKEAMLKSALQSQLDGVRTGLELLKSARKDLVYVAKHMTELQKLLKDVLSLGKALDEVRDESFRHSQYAMAMENMSNIFNINKNLEKAHALIAEGKLLQAHIRLSELEMSRDELLCEMYRMNNKTEHLMLLDYFDKVGLLSETLERHLTLNLKRTINTARKEPTVLVTTLRIIEREEKADALALQRFEMTGSKPPGRFKKWKDKAFAILEESVTERLEASQLETRAENKLWLVRYLEVMRQLILQDLLVVKSLCVPCFPPSYNILQRYVNMYHSCLCQRLEECITSGLEGNEFVSLLGWAVKTYTGPDLLRNPQLNLSPADIPKSLFSPATLAQLMKDYLQSIRQNYCSWRMRTVAKEVEEWWNNSSPQRDSHGHWHTEAPVIIFQMVDENLQVAKTVNEELVHEMLLLSLDMIREYGQLYGKEVTDFKAKYFEDRSKVQNFTQFMIAIVNNCLISIELAHQTKDRYWNTAVGNSQTISQFDAVLQTFETLRTKATGFLLEEAFLDLEPHFQALVTRQWLNTSVALETICVTLEDYFQDYVHLKPRNFDLVMQQGRNLVAKKYLLAVMSRKVALKNQDERKETADKITKEASHIRRLFDKVAASSSASSTSAQMSSSAGIGKGDCPLNALDAVAEVVKVDELDILSLELHGFIKHYPDVTKEQLMAILSLRGDIGRFDLKPKASEIIPGNSAIQRGPMPQSIFSQVHIPPSLFS